MIKKRRGRKVVPTSQTPVSPMTKEREKIQKRMERTYDKLRNKCEGIVTAQLVTANKKGA
jgi:hypothetical protein